jgi:tetratricopeptide (TPR) repeat protein
MTRKAGTISRSQGGTSSRQHEFAGAELRKHWEALHRADHEPWPDEPRLQDGWRAFHAGDFPRAIKLGTELGSSGAVLANKATAVQTLYSKQNAARVQQTLEAAISRGEKAVRELPSYANAHYTLALVLGRYSQRISILKALAEGLAGRVRSHLERTLELEPRHAEAHLALGLYHAEILNKLGSLAGGLTYNVSAKEALEHFRQASRLAPSSPIVDIEHAHGLLLLDADGHRAEAQSLYERAAARDPLDAMETQDVEYAKRQLA